MPVGVPRFSASNHSARALAADGNIGASPIPSTTLSPMNAEKLLIRPEAVCATDQPSSAAPSEILLPRRSMIMPSGNWEKAYARENADNRMPICDGVIAMSRWIEVLAIDSALRST
ncbi:hypothetical protein D3C80_1897660 [compost metagenome]